MTSRPALSLIVARAQNGVIGKDGDMPWRLSEDLKRFKSLTAGKPIIMGRATWESLPRKPLPKRPNVVISRNTQFSAPGAWLASDLSVALAYGEAMAVQKDCEEFFVIGGARLYADALPFAKHLYLTEVLAEIDGDTFFPEINETEWQEVEAEDLPADAKNTFPTRYRHLVRT